MFVMGIDPGLSRCGYGVVQRAPGAGRSGMRALAAGVVTTPVPDGVPRRLAALGAELRALLVEYSPAVVVVERVLFQANARTAMAVGQASGMALAAAADLGAEVVQYSPNEVKMAVTGYGSATKAQVQTMVQAILELTDLPRPPDVADALALAICHLGRAPLARRAALAEAGWRVRATGSGGGLPPAAGVGSAGLGSAGGGPAGLGSAGLGSGGGVPPAAGVGSAGLGSAGGGPAGLGSAGGGPAGLGSAGGGVPS